MNLSNKVKYFDGKQVDLCGHNEIKEYINLHFALDRK